MNDMGKTKRIVLTALFAAIICITTAFIFHIPTGMNGGYIHIGDAFIYIAASLLPTPYAMIAAALGAGLSDLLSGGVVWIIPTIIIKSVLTIFFTDNSEKILCKKNIFGVFIAGIVGWFGYYIATAVMFGNFLTPLTTFFIDIIQPIGSGVIFTILGFAIDKINLKKRISIKSN